LGYGFGVLTYQIGTFSRDPATATMWIGVIIGLIVAGVVSLVVSGRRNRTATLAPAE
jgi:hypothetical protein